MVICFCATSAASARGPDIEGDAPHSQIDSESLFATVEKNQTGTHVTQVVGTHIGERAAMIEKSSELAYVAEVAAVAEADAAEKTAAAEEEAVSEAETAAKTASDAAEISEDEELDSAYLSIVEAKKAAEDAEAQRLKQEEEERAAAVAAEAKRKAELLQKKKAAEAKRKAEAEAKQKSEQQAKEKAEAESKKKQEEESAAKKKAEDEAKKREAKARSKKKPLAKKVPNMADHHLEPTLRDKHYAQSGRPINVAQYLVDLHDVNAIFDFCGGMMFQLVLSENLRSHLAKVAKGDGQQPVIFPDSMDRMAKIPIYSRDARADNWMFFHGREIRKVPTAAGGMGFVLHLSMAGGDGDPDGWTQEEIGEYDGWAHDSKRTWRKGERLEKEGWETFRRKYGEEAFTLNHRFYLHFDKTNRMWLSAEDGCEGTPAPYPGWRPNPVK